MPAILTHYTFSLSALPDEDKPFRDIVALGSQGPDAFMAFGTIPWVKRSEAQRVRDFGHTMHAISIVDTYYKMMEYARNSEDKDLLFAYIDGILMHFSVDRIFHAYIFYRSGFDQDGKLRGYWSWSHGAFEAILDKFFAKRKGTYQRLNSCIEADEEAVKKVSKMWAYASPVPLKEMDFYESYLDFVGAEKMLYTPHGFKRPLFRLIGKYSTPWAQSHPLHIKKFIPMDVENLSHQMWKDPCTGQEHFESVDDMFEAALKDYGDVHQIVLKAKKGEDVKEALLAWSKNLNHDGMPLGLHKQYQDLCWKVLGKDKYLPPKK